MNKQRKTAKARRATKLISKQSIQHEQALTAAFVVFVEADFVLNDDVAFRAVDRAIKLGRNRVVLRRLLQKRDTTRESDIRNAATQNQLRKQC